MAADFYWVGADGAGPSAYLLAGLGLGLLIAGMALGWLFRESWRRAEYHMAERVAGMVADILTTKAASGATDLDRQYDIAEQVLFDYAKMREWLDERTARYAHVARGGSPTDSPTKWKLERKD